MRVIYGSIKQKLNDAIARAEKDNLLIEKILLTKAEMKVFTAELNVDFKMSLMYDEEGAPYVSRYRGIPVDFETILGVRR